MEALDTITGYRNLEPIKISSLMYADNSVNGRYRDNNPEISRSVGRRN